MLSGTELLVIRYSSSVSAHSHPHAQRKRGPRIDLLVLAAHEYVDAGCPGEKNNV